MRVMGVIGVKLVVILVDLRSTHNFLDPGIAQLTRLKIEEATSLQVKVANGEKLLSKGRCENTMVKIQGNKFLVSFHVLNLGGCNVVLEVRWLRTLGLIIWDFLKMTMELQMMGTRMVLQGLCAGETSIEDGSCFPKPSSVEKKGWLLQLMPTEAVGSK